MPSKYIVRSFSENSYYHVFNRGIDKKIIFKDSQDYEIFKYYLEAYLLPIEKVLKKYKSFPIRLINKNMHSSISLLSYCLMPNHIHLLLHQISKNAVSNFMKRLTNAYTEYFNEKYKRKGTLMESRFKAVSIGNDDHLLHVSRYIHLNPIVSSIVKDLKSYKYSSYFEYMNKNEDKLCETSVILSRFKSPNEYKAFIKNQISYAKELEKLKHLIID